MLYLKCIPTRLQAIMVLRLTPINTCTLPVSYFFEMLPIVFENVIRLEYVPVNFERHASSSIKDKKAAVRPIPIITGGTVKTCMSCTSRPGVCLANQSCVHQWGQRLVVASMPRKRVCDRSCGRVFMHWLPMHLVQQ